MAAPRMENPIPILKQPGVRWYGTIAQRPVKRLHEALARAAAERAKNQPH